ncbi:hypothetical protein B6U67_04680 [Methanosarcinales archaeon ex4484_138]|nr:MAG: hypothetical protein B6U67_04680 [Methanosarcinales archaeon ex4484_138]RLG24690.1 MAG: hypothetical protein DRN85_07280 [Methanosarcinales archaeon]
MNTDHRPSIDRTIMNLVKNMNKHVPARRNLEELLEEPRPHVIGKDGRKQHISMDELTLISKIIPQEEWKQTRLPILLEMTTEFEETAVRVQGRNECRIVQSVLETRKSGNRIILYLPEIQQLRRKLQTTTQYAFYTRLNPKNQIIP